MNLFILSKKLKSKTISTYENPLTKILIEIQWLAINKAILLIKKQIKSNQLMCRFLSMQVKKKFRALGYCQDRHIRLRFSW